MKLILASAFGMDIKKVAEKTEEFTGKPLDQISVAFIITASADSDSNKRWLIDDMYNLSGIFGGKITIVDLIAVDLLEIEKRLYAADVIYCFGGTTDYLKKIFELTGFDKLLPKLLEEKVWLGSSAGSVILGRRGFYKDDPELNDKKTYGITEYMGLVDGVIMPHVWRNSKSRYTLDDCIEESRKNDCPVYVLSDEAALIVDGKEIYMVGRDCKKLENGNITEHIK